MVKRLIAIAALALMQTAAMAESIELSGREVDAIGVAVAAFKRGRYSASGGLAHFTVEVDRHGKQLEITFVPDQPPLRRPNEAATGGSTIYGQEVHFFVALDSLRIVRWHLAR